MYLFDERHNPLGIQDLSIFKEVMTKFKVGLGISDDLSTIRLEVAALRPDKQLLHKHASLSFVPSHPNFICKALKKPIKVRLKHK